MKSIVEILKEEQTIGCGVWTRRCACSDQSRLSVAVHLRFRSESTNEMWTAGTFHARYVSPQLQHIPDCKPHRVEAVLHLLHSPSWQIAGLGNWLASSFSTLMLWILTAILTTRFESHHILRISNQLVCGITVLLPQAARNFMDISNTWLALASSLVNFSTILIHGKRAFIGYWTQYCSAGATT
jgi:hypothetical protein